MVLLGGRTCAGLSPRDTDLGLVFFLTVESVYKIFTGSVWARCCLRCWKVGVVRCALPSCLLLSEPVAHRALREECHLQSAAAPGSCPCGGVSGFFIHFLRCLQGVDGRAPGSPAASAEARRRKTAFQELRLST